MQVISAMAHHGYLEQPGGEALVEYLVQQCALPPKAEVRAADPAAGCELRAASCRLGWGAGSAGAAGPQPEHRWVSDRGLRHVPRSGPRFQSGCTASAAGPEVGGSPWAFQFRATEQTPFLVEGAGQTEAVGRWPAGLPHRVLG